MHLGLGAWAPRRKDVATEGLGASGRGGSGASSPSRLVTVAIGWISRSVLASGHPPGQFPSTVPGLRQVMTERHGLEVRGLLWGVTREAVSLAGAPRVGMPAAVREASNGQEKSSEIK